MAISHVEYFNESATATSLDVTGVSWAAGDLIIVIAHARDANDTFNTCTSPNLTFAERGTPART